MFKEDRNGTTHWVCNNRLRDEGGEAKCCLCVPHDNCGDDNEINKYKQKETIEDNKLK